MEKLNSEPSAELLDEDKIRCLRYSRNKVDSEDLAQICEQYHLDYQSFLPGSSLPLNKKLAQLLHEYRVVVSSFSGSDQPCTNDTIKAYAKERINFESPSISMTVHAIYEDLNKEEPVKGKKRHPAYSLEYNLILAFMYIAARNSGNPVFLIDIIESAANNSLPYFTGYSEYLRENKSLAKGYTLTPTNLPTTHWLRKVVTRMAENGDCELAPFPFQKCFRKIQSELNLPQVIINAAEYLHSKLRKHKIKQRQATLSDEAMVLGSIIFVIKLLYGLDDKPYVNAIDPILKEVFSEEMYKKLLAAHDLYERHDHSILASVTSTLPTLYKFVKNLRESVKKKRSSTMPWKITELHELSMEQINHYLDYCETVVFSQPISDPSTEEYTPIYNSLSDIFRTLEVADEPPDSTLEVKVLTSDKEKDMSEYILEELEFAQNASTIIERNSRKKVAFPHPSDSYIQYKHIFSDLTKDPISYEYQHLLIIFGKYLSEPINQLIRAVKVYEDMIIP